MTERTITEARDVRPTEASALEALRAQAAKYAAAKGTLDARRADLHAAIREARALGISLRTIAAAAGVSNPRIQQITGKGSGDAADT